MREYLNRKLIIETLKSHPGQAFLVRELERITTIPIKTLRSNLRHLVHEKRVYKKILGVQMWNKKKTQKIEQAQVWYYMVGEDVCSKQPSSSST